MQSSTPGYPLWSSSIVARLVGLRRSLVRILQTPKNSLLNQFRKLVKFHGADLMFTDAAVREIARIALERGTGARGLRSVVEEVLEGVLFEVEAGAKNVINEQTVRGGEAVRQRMAASGA